MARMRSRERWLVAGWPGMGQVAVTAAVYLMSKLKMRQVGEFDARDLFELEAADVEDGLVSASALPRSRLFLAERAAPDRDVAVFIGEAQPPAGKLALCNRLLRAARGLRVTRVFCLAAWAAEMEPGGRSHVHGAATDPALLNELRRLEVTVLKSGRVAGLNGVLLAAAAEAGLPGVGLLGEVPALAPAIPYPTASSAVLSVFAAMAGLPLDLEPLDAYGREMQSELAEVYRRALSAMTGPPPDAPDEPGLTPRLEPAPLSPEGLEAEDAARVESLFEAARDDRGKAFDLKRELDRLGVFRAFEDRFLALFKH
jgi:proteasome assembly chaperone (PAC2) family protein